MDSYVLRGQAKALVEKTGNALLRSRGLVIASQALMLKATDLRRACAYIRRSTAKESVSS